jgi:polysaccharide export outer membrane protein
MLPALFLAACGASLNDDGTTTTLTTPEGTGLTSATKPAGASASVAAKPGAAVATASTPTASTVGAPTSPSSPTALSDAAGSAAAPAAETFTAVSTPGNTAYKIGPQDVLDVSVFKVPELSKSVQVADSGTINLPLVGEVAAAGKTAQEVERDLTKKLGAKYLQSPQVTVFVKEYNSQRVTIEGAVKKPGVYPVRGKTSLLQFIAMAEGLDPAAQDEIVVFRQIDGKRVAGKFDVEEIRAGTQQDPAIREGDVIVVTSSGMKAAWQTFLKAVPAAASVAMFF